MPVEFFHAAVTAKGYWNKADIVPPWSPQLSSSSSQHMSLPCVPTHVRKLDPSLKFSFPSTTTTNFPMLLCAVRMEWTVRKLIQCWLMSATHTNNQTAAQTTRTKLARMAEEAKEGRPKKEPAHATIDAWPGLPAVRTQKEKNWLVNFRYRGHAGVHRPKFFLTVRKKMFQKQVRKDALWS